MAWRREAMSNRLIWIDCMMTSLDESTAKLMEIAVIVTGNNVELKIVDQTGSLAIHHDASTLENMEPWCRSQFLANRLIRDCRASEISCEDAEKTVLDMLQKHTKEGQCRLAGNRVDLVLKFIDKYMPTLGSWLSKVTLDVTDIRKEIEKEADDVSWLKDWYNNCPKKRNRHRALSNIMESIAEYKFYLQRGFKSPSDVYELTHYEYCEYYEHWSTSEDSD